MNNTNDDLILKILESGAYKVNAKDGILYSRITKKSTGCVSNGRLKITVQRNKISHTISIARIIWISVYGKIEDCDLFVTHKNGNSLNNKLDNLCLGVSPIRRIKSNE